MEWLIGLLVVAGLLVVYVFTTYNGFVSLKNKCEEAFSTMDVYLTKRYDLIPNLVETVKGYASHEKETLDSVISARNKAVNATSVEDKIAAEQGLAGTLGRLFALSENYPDLKANTNFLDLQAQLQLMESEIANASAILLALAKDVEAESGMVWSDTWLALKSRLPGYLQGV